LPAGNEVTNGVVVAQPRGDFDHNGFIVTKRASIE